MIIAELDTACPKYDHAHCPRCDHVGAAVVEAGAAYCSLECQHCTLIMIWERARLKEHEDKWTGILGSLVLTRHQSPC